MGIGIGGKPRLAVKRVARHLPAVTTATNRTKAAAAADSAADKVSRNAPGDA